MTISSNKTAKKQRSIVAKNDFEARLFKRFEEIAKQDAQKNEKRVRILDAE